MDGEEANLKLDEEKNTWECKKSVHNLTHKLIVRLCMKPFAPPCKGLVDESLSKEFAAL